jgi:histidine ammonia-lyase
MQLTKHKHNFTSNGANLTPTDVARLARAALDPETGSATLTAGMSAEALRKVEASRAIVDGIVERGEVVYGITTGFGAFKDRLIPPDEVAQLQVNMILSHCVGVGPALPAEVVRAMMLCRAHTLSLGYSGIRPATLKLIYEMLNAGIHPVVPAQGSVGASGDLAPLCHMSAGMIAHGQVEWRGQLVPAAEALQGAGLQPAVLMAKEGLALSNGTSLMAGLLSLATVDAAMLCDTADVVGAMSLEALQGVSTAFDPRIHAARGQRGQMTSAANIRNQIEGSTLIWQDTPGNGHEKVAAGKVQDAYALRCMPQVHGPVRDAVGYVEGVLGAELNGAEDNPLVFGAGDVGQGEDIAILSGGNFHGAPLALAADFLGTALCGLANISERRQARLVDVSAHGGLFPAFLVEQGGVNSGFMLVQYTSAALASENKSLAHPAGVDTIPTAANNEDHVSMGPIAARHARDIAANTARVLALEAMMAAQALDFRLKANPTAHMGRGTRAAYELIRERVPFLSKDEYIAPHIEAMEELVRSGGLANVKRKT